jgi:hypothetical protein
MHGFGQLGPGGNLSGDANPHLGPGRLPVQGMSGERCLVMDKFDHGAASKAISSLELRGMNKAVSRHWLSVWRNEKPPTSSRFFETCNWRSTPAIAIFEVCKGQSITCVLAGSYYRVALGFELTGQDLLALTPAADRETRLERVWAIGDGAIMAAQRKFASLSGGEESIEEVYLPLSDVAKPDTRTYLMHSNWRPVGEGWVQGSAGTNLGLADEPNALSLG